MQTKIAPIRAMAVLAALAASRASAQLAAPDDFLDYPPAYADPATGSSDDPVFRSEFALGLGWSRIEFDGDAPLVDARDCIHFEPVLSFVPFGQVPQLRLGAAVGWSAALDDTSGAIISGDNGLIVVTSSDVSFMMFEPELRLSWRQPVGPGGLYFLEPGVAAGAAIGWLDLSGRDPDDAAAVEQDISETDASFQWKVFLRAGVPFSNGLAGIEASYMTAGELDFGDDIRGEPSEFYLGIWGALQF